MRLKKGAGRQSLRLGGSLTRSEYTRRELEKGSNASGICGGDLQLPQARTFARKGN
jgi:hypothetical protein